MIKHVPGLVASVLLGVVAILLGRLVPALGAPPFAVLGGMLIGPFLTSRGLAPGLGFAKGTLLQVSVVLLGAQLSLGEVVAVGSSSLPVMLGTLAVCLLLAWLVGRWLGIGRDLRTLIGVGTAICGASAIAATAPAIRARSTDVAYAVSTIFLCNVAAVFVFPPLGHLLGLSQESFGLFAGTAVNDTSSVVAVAGAYGHAAADHAVVVKLVRTLMIVPVVAFVGRRASFRLVPWFLVAFLIAAGLHTLHLIPFAGLLRPAALLLIAVALAAIGLGTDLGALRRTGSRPLLLGVFLWVAVAATSLGLQQLAGL